MLLWLLLLVMGLSTVTCVWLLACVCACKTAQIQGYGHSDNMRIIGGHPVKIEEAPFMAQFQLKGDPGAKHYCGASIVHEQFLLTAAHCYQSEEQVYATVGTDKLGEGIDVEIEDVFRHPEYNNTIKNNDITVVKLKEKLTFNEKIQPIKMADPSIVIDGGTTVTTLGFGGKGPMDDSSPILLGVEGPVVNQKSCAKYFIKGNFSVPITDEMICAGIEGKHSCYGDSGGPLIYKNTLIGVVSFGDIFCGDHTGAPGVYARVSALRDFIDGVIKDHS